MPLQQIATRELAQSLCDASHETGRQVGALVHRSGEVDYVIVGDAGKLELPNVGRLRAAQGRFRGLRLIHTHLRNEPLTRDDLVDLVRLRLDLVAAIQLGPDGQPGQVLYAHNVPQLSEADPSYREVGPVRLERLDVDFGVLIAGLENEFAKLARTREVVGKDGRAILVHVGEKTRRAGAEGRAPTRTEASASLRELRELARTAGVEVVDTVLQQRERIDPKFVLGRGKLDDVLVRAMQLDAETLIFDCELSPSQATAIARVTDLKIIDRTQLILDIFAQRAESRDGKLQVELAQLKYALPRLAQKDDALSRLTGGIGGRGPGETKLEIGRRRAKERVHHLEQQVKALAKQRIQRRRRRGRSDIPVVAIVGYTNAGKSTLLNTLTGSHVLAEDRLFATLDTRSRRLHVEPPPARTSKPSPENEADRTSVHRQVPPSPAEGEGGQGGEVFAAREIVLVDTVGFIRDLPEDLFAAFRATFEEAADADLLVHVVDASDPAHGEQIRTTEALLTELGLGETPRLLVYNKADLLPPGDGERSVLGKPDTFLVSAEDRESTKVLVAGIARALDREAARRALAAQEDAFVIDGAIVATPRDDFQF